MAEELSQVIAETDRRVEAEADLDRRTAILEEAHQRYPGEPHFERALRLVRDKRDLVNSIVAKARFFETRGQFQDAIDQWRMLRSVYEQQPGLDSEIQRLVDRLDRAGEDHGAEALDFLAKSQELSSQGAHAEALAALRQAHQLDPANAVLRTVLLHALVAQAKRLVASDPPAAQALLPEILALDPDYPTDRILRTPQPTEARPAAAPIAELPAVPPPPPATPPSPEEQAQAVVRKMEAQPKKLLLGTAAAVAALLLLALGVTFLRHSAKKTPPPPPSKYAIELNAAPEGAEIKFNGEVCGISSCKLTLAAGSYQVQAHFTGYQDSTSTFTVGPGATTDIKLTLAPLPPRVAIFTDLADGAVTLDETPAAQIQSGGAEIQNLTPGKHVLAVKSGDSAASIPINITPGAPPELDGAIDTHNLRCFLVAGYGADAHVYGSATGYRATLDGKPLGSLPAAGLPLKDLAAGTHELALDNEAGQHDKIVFESQPSPTLYVSLGGSQNLGVVFVETNQDQAQVYIDGQKYKRDTTRGRLVVYLPPKKYSIVVQKDGFAPAVAQTVDVKRGVESKVSFNLLPARASLAVHHAPPSTDVLVDGIKVGTTHPDGEFQVGGVDPGRHTIALHNDKFKPFQVDEIFLSGKPVEIQANMEPLVLTGTLRFDINPPAPDAHIRIQRDGDPQDREVAGPTATVPEGHYTVTVSAPQYTTTSTAVQVTAGATAVATIPLRHVEAPKAPPKTAPAAVSFGLEDWLKVAGWSQRDGMIARRGGDWVLAPPEFSRGTIHFIVVSIKGKHVEWAVGYHDDRNYLLFDVDDKNLTRYAVHNGAKSLQTKVPHQLDRKHPMSFTLVVGPQSITVSVDRGIPLDIDQWSLPAGATQGKFGFHVSGSDEIGLQEFRIGGN